MTTEKATGSPSTQSTPSTARMDSSLVQTRPSTDGFVAATIVKARMTGSHFEWEFVGVKPDDGSHFEIRPKDGSSALMPSIPVGVDRIIADARPRLETGTIYTYALWQVLADGNARELEDPELEIIYF
jgi:hypothetical protein